MFVSSENNYNPHIKCSECKKRHVCKYVDEKKKFDDAIEKVKGEKPLGAPFDVSIKCTEAEKDVVTSNFSQDDCAWWTHTV